MLRPTVLLFLLWCACAKAVSFEDCGSLFEVSSINITGCSAPPCDIVPGSTRSMTLTFIAGSESNELFQDIYLWLNFIKFPVTVTPDDESDTKCPVGEGDICQYSVAVTFGEDLVPVPGWLFWKLQNNQGITVVCINVEVRIVYDAKTLDAQQP